MSRIVWGGGGNTITTSNTISSSHRKGSSTESSRCRGDSFSKVSSSINISRIITSSSGCSSPCTWIKSSSPVAYDMCWSPEVIPISYFPVLTHATAPAEQPLDNIHLINPGYCNVTSLLSALGVTFLTSFQ